MVYREMSMNNDNFKFIHKDATVKRITEYLEEKIKTNKTTYKNIFQ